MAKHVGGAVVAVIVSSGLALGQSPAGPSGHWEGTLQVPGQELKLLIDLGPAGEKWEGTVSVPEQGMKGFPLSDITVLGDTVSFAMKGIPGDPQFKGTLSKDGKALSGTFTQGGGSIPFAVTRTGDAKIERPAKSTPVTKDLEGSWEGTLDVDGTKLRLVLKLANQPDGTASGSLVSVDQNGAEMPISTITQTESHLKVAIPVISGSYEGDLKGGELTGTWTQGPRSWPLAFKRSK